MYTIESSIQMESIGNNRLIKSSQLKDCFSNYLCKECVEDTASSELDSLQELEEYLMNNDVGGKVVALVKKFRRLKQKNKKRNLTNNVNNAN